MGRTSRCLRSLFIKKINNNTTTSYNKRNWITTLLKSCNDDNSAGATANSVVSIANASGKAIARGENDESASYGYAIVDDYSYNKTVADAAAQVADEVVRITRSARLDFDPSRRAAVRIQSVFRGYLARKALRALRALVRLQALVRGYIVRKRAVDQVRRMHALIRAQARARAIRAPVPASSYSSSRITRSSILDPPTPEECAAQVRKRLVDQIKLVSGRASSRRFDEEKIAEVDSSTKPFNSTKNKNLFVLSDYLSYDAYQTPPIPYPSEDLYLQYSNEIDRYSLYTADDDILPSHTGSFRSSSVGRRGHIAPADVNCSQSCLSGYQDHPNYMAYTKSSKAKMRSLSAPKQRTQLDRSTSEKCFSSHDFGSMRLSTSGAC